MTLFQKKSVQHSLPPIWKRRFTRWRCEECDARVNPVEMTTATLLGYERSGLCADCQKEEKDV